MMPLYGDGDLITIKFIQAVVECSLLPTITGNHSCPMGHIFSPVKPVNDVVALGFMTFYFRALSLGSNARTYVCRRCSLTSMYMRVDVRGPLHLSQCGPFIGKYGLLPMILASNHSPRVCSSGLLCALEVVLAVEPLLRAYIALVDSPGRCFTLGKPQQGFPWHTSSFTRFPPKRGIETCGTHTRACASLIASAKSLMRRVKGVDLLASMEETVFSLHDKCYGISGVPFPASSLSEVSSEDTFASATLAPTVLGCRNWRTFTRGAAFVQGLL
ncbi:hypothetical protein Tco_0746593 [Tanacetum coccineum]